MGTRANAIIPTHFEHLSKVQLPELLRSLGVSVPAHWRPCPPFDTAQGEFANDGYTMFMVNDPLVTSLRVSRSGLHIHSPERWSGWGEDPERLMAFARASNDCAKLLGADWYLLHGDDDVLEEKLLSFADVAILREHVNKMQVPIISLTDLAPGLLPAKRCVVVRTQEWTS